MHSGFEQVLAQADCKICFLLGGDRSFDLRRPRISEEVQTKVIAGSLRHVVSYTVVSYTFANRPVMNKLFCASLVLAMLVAAIPGQRTMARQDPISPFPASGQQKPQDEEKKTTDPVVIDVDTIRQPGTPVSPLAAGLQQQGPDQKILVKEKFAGWKQAGLGGSGDLTVDALRSNWVLIGSNGLLRGNVIGTADGNAVKIPVHLLSGGRVQATSWTDENGTFTFSNVQQGTYSLIGFGDDAFFAFSFNAIDYAESIAAKMPDQITVLAVPNSTTLNLDWIRYFAPNVQFRVYGRFLSQQGAEDPAWLYGTEGISLIGPESAPATSISTHPVGLNSSGFMTGRVHQIDELNGRPVDVRNTRVMLLQDDGVVAAVSADNHGVFEFGPVQPGRYSLVAVGSDGMGCIGIDAIDGTNNEAAMPADFAIVSPETIGWLNHTATEIAYQRIIGRKKEPADSDNCAVCGGAMNNGMCCGECGTQGMGNSSSQGLKRFWRDVNAFFDVMFYGETFEYSNGQNGNGGGGYGGGYQGGGYQGDGASNCPNCVPGNVPVYQEVIELPSGAMPHGAIVPAPTPAGLHQH